MIQFYHLDFQEWGGFPPIDFTCLDSLATNENATATVLVKILAHLGEELMNLIILHPLNLTAFRYSPQGCLKQGGNYGVVLEGGDKEDESIFIVRLGNVHYLQHLEPGILESLVCLGILFRLHPSDDSLAQGNESRLHFLLTLLKASGVDVDDNGGLLLGLHFYCLHLCLSFYLDRWSSSRHSNIKAECILKGNQSESSICHMASLQSLPKMPMMGQKWHVLIESTMLFIT